MTNDADFLSLMRLVIDSVSATRYNDEHVRLVELEYGMADRLYELAHRALKVEDLYEWRCLSCGFEPDDLFTESEGKQRGWDVQKNICPNCNEINLLKAERDALKAEVEQLYNLPGIIAADGGFIIRKKGQ